MSRIPRECKRLAEVDFPIAEVSRHSAREKSIRQGHPSMLHLWWARRPLASSRAMLLALLLPDPNDPSCPQAFKDRVAEILPRTLEEVGPRKGDLRNSLLKFIADSVEWEKTSDPSYLHAARSLVKAAYGDNPPLVVDPFAGGGSIPLEALRLRCGAFGSDLNPVACLVLKVLLEDLPKDGGALAADLREAGTRVKSAAEKETASLYPSDPDGATPIAYLWARTIRCESPNCGAEIPLTRSFWLTKKANRKRALRPTVQRSHGQPPIVNFDIFEPSGDKEVSHGTVARANATCLACGTTLPPDRVRAQLRSDVGGGDTVFDKGGVRVRGARLMAIVTIKKGIIGRKYRLPVETDYQAVFEAKRAMERAMGETLPGGLSTLPDEILPPQGTLGFRVQLYGMTHWRDLFTARQKVALSALARHAILQVPSVDHRRLLALAVSRCTDYWSSGVVWAQEGEFVAHTFGRQALPMVWDFAEAVPWTDSSGNFDGAVDWVASVASSIGSAGLSQGQAQLADAVDSPLPDDSASVWFTDPPYYDAIPYSDLSDFFFVWLKRILPESDFMRDPFDGSNALTPKLQEIVQDEVKVLSNGEAKDGVFFETAMTKAFGEGRRVLKDDGIGCVVFAHKTTEGWEALLSGMIQEGWVITGSWPIATERPGRLRSQDSAALATSVHLVCRPRASGASVGDWAEVVRELPERVRTWMQRLEGEGIRGADLVFACIGPAMEVYSRYSKVVDAQDREIPLGGDPAADDPHEKGFLAKVWEVVGKLALEQILGGVKDGPTSLEEDARLTALFLWTFQSSAAGPVGVALPSVEVALEEVSDDDSQINSGGTGGYSLPHDVVRRFAQPLGIHLESWEGRIIRTEKGVVQLLPVEDRTVQLFGQENVAAASSGWEDSVSQRGRQLSLFPDEATVMAERPAKGGAKRPRNVSLKAEGGVEGESRRKTTLDRLHTAMLLQASGATAALKTFLEEEHRRGPDLEKLANALAALYPRGSEERRLVEALTLAFPR